MYFLGGVEIAGFGRILGHALALLYVARHGLKESELWSILSSMPKLNHDSVVGSDVNKSQCKQPVTDEMRALISVCAHYREKFRSSWQSNDLLHTNRLSPKKLLLGMQNVNSEFTQQDLDLLLTILDCNPREVTPQSGSQSNSKTVDYTILLERIARAEKVIKMESIRKKNKNSAKCKSDFILLL